MKRRGWTLVENLTAATCLVVVAASVGNAVGFSAARTNFEKQRSVVVSRVRSDIGETEAMSRLGAAPVSGVTQISSLYGVPAGFSLARTVTEDTANKGRYFVEWEGKWTTDRENVVRVSSAVTVSLGQIVTVNPKSTFGVNYNIPADMPVAIDLEARGIVPGDRITLAPVNTWTAWGSNPPPAWLAGLVALFSSTNEVLPAFSLVERVPGAVPVAAGPGFVTGDRWSLAAGFPTATFQVSSNNPGLRSSTSVVVPAGARYLFVGVGDIPYHTDNRSSLEGFGVRIAKIASGVSGGAEVLVDSRWMYGSQGFNGMSFGYFEAATLAAVDEKMWRFMRKNNDAQFNDSAYSVDGGLVSGSSPTPSAFWNLQGVTWMHPSGGGSRTGGSFHIAARRWTAAIGATNAVLTANWTRNDASSSGVELSIVKNGVAIWSDSFSRREAAGVSKPVSLNLGRLNAGDWFEFRLGPGSNDSYDSTVVWFQLSGVPD
ncbi:hypothetical protein C0431_11845 [bacterium]|nr:hypothetical protein [bacterium]